MQNIYLDYAATTPLDKRVLDVMLPYFDEKFGNPSSIHRYGQQAENAVEAARETVASILNCQASEVIFTSCGSESDNLALRGAALAMRKKNGTNCILTSKTEHHAVSKTAEQLEKYYGFKLKWLPVDKYGMLTPGAVEDAIDSDTAVVSIMYANNEIGTLNPIKEIAKICRAHGIVFHSDAVQAAAYLTLDTKDLGVDLLSLGAHKFYGPKGVGALYIRKGTPLIANQTGGGQEFGMRAGTQNVPYIVGFAEALRLTNQEREVRSTHVALLRDHIITTILKNIPNVQLTGHPQYRLPQHASFAFKDLDGNLLLTMLDSAGFACSSGSACKTGNPEPSEVMTAIALTRDWALGSLRITVGAATTIVEVNAFLDILPSIILKARTLSQRG